MFLSLDRKNPTFLSWEIHRLFRIWPSIWICYGAFALTGFAEIPLCDFFLPLTTNWFLGAILVFYPIFFICLKMLKNNLLLLFGLSWGVFVGAFFLLEPNPQSWVVGVGSPYKLHWIYYFGIMILGAECARRELFQAPLFAGSSVKRCVCALGVFAGSVIFYYALRGGFEYAHLWKLQFIAPFALPLVCISGIAFCKSFTDVFPIIFTGKSYRAISFVSNHTLEIYLTHGVGLALCINIFFPLNLLCLVCVTLCLAALLKFTSNLPERMWRKRRVALK